MYIHILRLFMFHSIRGVQVEITAIQIFREQRFLLKNFERKLYSLKEDK